MNWVVVADFVAKGSPWAFVALVVLAIVSGRLVPRQALLDVQADRSKWEQLALESMRHSGHLGEEQEVTHKVVTALSPANVTDAKAWRRRRK
jgi:hypothetical protein